MKKILFFLAVFLFGTVHAEQLALADPFILLHDGVYYAYGTNRDDGIAVYVSDDLINWESRGLALHKKDTWAEKFFWAPEVYKVGNRFLMYFSAEQHINAAFADSPLGPFVQQEKRSMMPEANGIDNSLFISSSGKPYIFWTMWKWKKGQKAGIYAAELQDDLITIKKNTIRRILGPAEPWERKRGFVAEGAFCIEHNGKFILTYSANDYRSHDYAIGAAKANSPLGPWKKYKHNPLLHRPGSLVGVGHHSFFRDKQGKLKIVFHAHNTPSKVHPRLTYIADVGFVNGKLQISSNYIPLKVKNR